MSKFPIIRFNQFGSSSSEDELFLFAAPAKEIAQWAGIPKKGWRIRMLFQRWITESRKAELVDFWTRASNPGPKERYIVGPTAIVVAIQSEPVLVDGMIDLTFNPSLDVTKGPAQNLTTLASIVFPSVLERLSSDQRKTVKRFAQNPLVAELPESGHDYVFEFALQLAQIIKDVGWFINTHSLVDSEVGEIVQALDAITRPAVVVDGQHRLWGASQVQKKVWLPVVAYPNAKWTDQIYQFIVINEKAKPIEESLLTDIFGSSLTKDEQEQIRIQLSRSNVEVESRIAAVIAGRDPSSPFNNMVRLKVDSPLPSTVKPFINDKIIRDLINSGGGARGWRTDEDFYEMYVSPTFSDEATWNNWTGGRWREYWFAFWRTIAKYYNNLQFQEEGLANGEFPLWHETQRSNLTKGVTLKILQNIFMDKASGSIRELEATREILIQALGEEEAQAKYKELLSRKALPSSLGEFEQQVIDIMLKYIPLKVFTADWDTSLDDQSGREHLYAAIEDIMEKVKKARGWQLRWYPNVFVPKKNENSEV
jgi:hypothetical protein